MLGVLAGVAGGIATAAVAGARRTDTVYERWGDETAAPDAIVFATQGGVFDADFSAVEDLPEVVDAGTFNLPFGAFVVVDGVEISSLPPIDDRLYRTLSRPLLDEGRLPDPDRADEIVVNRTAADQANLRVGSTVTIRTMTLPGGDLEAELEEGPDVEATVVGVGDSMMDQVFGSQYPGFVPSGALLTQNPEIPRAPNLVVRLRPGTDFAEFNQHVSDAMGVEDIPVRDLAEDAKRVTNGIDLERTALLLFAAAALIAGLVIVGQAIARLVYAQAEGDAALRAMGATRSQLVGTLCGPLGLSAAVAAVTTCGLAVALSPLFPIGLGGQLEPDPGVYVDAPVVALGAVVLAVVTIAIAAAAAARATGRRISRPYREPVILRHLRSVTALPVAIGTGLALERGRGERTLPVRPALVGAVAGILGVVGALGLVQGIDDAVAEPTRSGQVFDAFGGEGEPPEALEEIAAVAQDDDDVDQVAYVDRVPLDVNSTALPIYAIEPFTGTMTFERLSGREPRAPDEIALGPQSADALGVGIDDEVRVGGENAVTVRVVGIVLLPQTAHSSFDQGSWMTPAGLAPVAEDTKEFATRGVAMHVRDGADAEAVATRIGEETGYLVEFDFLPQDVVYLRNVRTLPVALAAFLALLGLAALGHVLVSAARRRRQDLAVLRALGFRPRQAAACIGWQATTVGIVGLVIGVPLGVAAGRISWRWVADRTPLVYVPPVAVIVILLAIPATLLLANALAVWPARRAARVRPAQVLRTE